MRPPGPRSEAHRRQARAGDGTARIGSSSPGSDAMYRSNSATRRSRRRLVGDPDHYPAVGKQVRNVGGRPAPLLVLPGRTRHRCYLRQVGQDGLAHPDLGRGGILPAG